MYNQPNPTRNYVYQYNLNIERQLTPTLSLLIGYSGSRGLHNPFQADTDQHRHSEVGPNYGRILLAGFL